MSHDADLDKNIKGSKKERIFIGVAWPYANGEQHIGHMAGAYLPPDIFARFHRMNGNEVLMVSGSDAHGTPIMIKAEEEKTTPAKIVERYHEHFIATYQRFGLSFDWFTSTASETHEKYAQEFFKEHLENGYLYRERQKQLFDTSTNRFLPDRYVEGTCPKCGFNDARGDQCDQCGGTYEAIELIAPKSKLSGSTALEIRETEHFFLDLAKLLPKLEEWINKDDKKHWRPQVINYARAQINSGELRGRPITRDLDWGVKIPIEGFDSKRMYVWYEAVIGYYSACMEWAIKQGLGEAEAKSWWDPSSAVKSYYFIGKDNVVFHTIMWPAMLLGRTKPYLLPYDVPANEYLNMYGRKFSKSRGNIVSISQVLDTYQADAWRYALTAMAPESTDMNFSWDDFIERVNNELVANWGNLVNRMLGFAAKRFDKKVPTVTLDELDQKSKTLLEEIKKDFAELGEHYRAVRLKSALECVRASSQKVNQYLSDRAPWNLIKTDPKVAAVAVYTALQSISWLRIMWAPILPFSSQAVHQMLGFQGQLFGDPKPIKVSDNRGTRTVLSYDSANAVGVWKLDTLKPGQNLGEPVVLFSKLEPKDVLPEG